MVAFRPNLPIAGRQYSFSNEQVTREEIERRLTLLEERLDNANLGTDSDGRYYNAVSVTATSDGLTTGLIGTGTDFVEVTSSDANHIITLPAGDKRQKIRGYIGATGCEMRTPSGSNATINGLDSDGSNEAAIPATTYFEAICVAADTWILLAWDEGGDDVAGIVPD